MSEIAPQTRSLRVFWSATRGVDCEVNNQTSFAELRALALSEMQRHETDIVLGDDIDVWTVFVEFPDDGKKLIFYWTIVLIFFYFAFYYRNIYR
jgi:hypothetical protein